MTTTGKPSGAHQYLVLDDQALIIQCEVDHYRSSGPGGQKRNKTSSAVRLRHMPTGLSVTATEDRSQHVNRRKALRRLRVVLALHVRSAIDLDGYAPGDNLTACRTEVGRLHVGRRDERYPMVVAELLDVLAACGLRLSEAAALIGTTTGQIVKFLENDPKLWERVNQMRAAAGLKPLRMSDSS